MKLPPIVVPFACALICAAPLTRGQTPLSPSPAAVAPVGNPSSPNAPLRLDPLRVTADLWESPLDRIPASVSIFDEQTLRSGYVRHFGDLADQIPNLTWTGGTSRPRYFQIRGIGENSQYEGETPDSTVRFLIDDLDFTGLGTLAGTFDVSQVEVLRGPQAGAFGANAAGGVVRLVTNAPTPFWSGQLQATLGSDNLREGGFAVGGPLSSRNPEKLMFRLSLHQHRSDGFRENVFLNRATHARDELMARLRVVASLSPAWRWDATVMFGNADNGFDDFALDNNGEKTFSDQPGRDEQRSYAGSARGTFSGLSGARFTTITNASRTKSRYSYDDDWTAASYEGFSDLGRERTVFNEEVRVDSTATRAALGWLDRWTIGAFFSRTTEDSTYTNTDPGNVRGLRTDYDATNLALFGQGVHNISANTRIIVGLRAERLDMDGRGTRSRFRLSSGAFDAPVSFAPQYTDELFGGKLTLEHDLTSRHLAFASLTRGYKGGGVNIDARINPPADPLTYDTEYLWNYEAGLRGHWLDQRLRGEFTAFLLQRRDTQVRDSAGFGGSYRFFTSNARGSDVYGIEASASFALTTDWSLHAAVSQMESELDRFVLSNGNAGGGRRLANTPRHGYNIGTRYRSDTGFFGNIDFVGRSRQFDSNNHDEARSAFNVVNASVGYSYRAWTFTLWGRNLFDERHEKRVFFFGNDDPDYIPTRYESRADPRQVGVSAAYRF